MLRIRNKRAQAEHLLANAFRVGFLLIALFAFFLLISYYLNNTFDTRLLQAETVANRILYSDVIMYQDPYTYRAYPGIVDLEKINTTRLQSALPYGAKRHVGIKLTIMHKPDTQGNSGFITEAYLNKDTYTNLETLIRANVRGKSSGIQVVKELPVTCFDKTATPQHFYCTLRMEIMIPNS